MPGAGKSPNLRRSPTPGFACLLGSCPAACIRRSGGADTILLPRTAVDWLNVLALLLVPVGLWASADLSTSWPAAYKVLAGFALFYGLAGLAGTKWMRTLPWFVLALAAGLGILVLLTTRWTPSKIPVLPVSLYELLPSMRLPMDVNGFHPNLAGNAVALLLLPAVALALWAPNKSLRLTAVAIACCWVSSFCSANLVGHGSP